MQGGRDIVRVVIMGPEKAGKSALFVRWLQGSFLDDFDPNEEFSYRKTLFLDDTPYAADVIDAHTSSEYDNQRPYWIQQADSFLMCFGVDDRKQFEEVEGFIDQVLRVKDYDKFPMVLVGCKADLAHPGRVTDEEGHQLAERYSCRYIWTSSKSDSNIEEAFRMAVQAAVLGGHYPPGKSLKHGKDAKQFLQRTKCSLQ